MTRSDSEADYRRQLHHLLYQALLEIRLEGGELKSGAIFGLANLLHNVPLELEQAAAGKITYEEAFHSLTTRAGYFNHQTWIDQEIAWLKTQDHDT